MILLALVFISIGAAPAPALDDAAVLEFLNRTIDWYHRITTMDQTTLNSQEYVFRETARENARQTLRLAFDFANAQAALLSSTTRPAAPTTGKSVNSRSLATAATNTAAHLTELRAQLDQISRAIPTTAPTSRPALEARRDKLNSAIDLTNSELNVLREYAGFVSNAESNGNVTLLDKIADLRRSVPELVAEDEKLNGADPTRSAATSQPSATAVAPESPGILNIITQMFSLTGRLGELRSIGTQTDALRGSVEQMRQPIRDDIVGSVRRATALTTPTTQQSDDPGKIDAERAELDGLGVRFKQLSAAGVPLGEQSVLLDAASQNLAQWRSGLEREYGRAVRSLLIRLAVMGVIILVLVVVSELWRRATYRYVQDARRRRQLMLVRRIAIGLVVVLIIIASVVTEFGSLATFAGLITAGIAVSLQTVILSGVAYFFFIGRFGVRVGDRVTVNGISGDVIEVGLFRLYLLELAGKAPDLKPTGRIVVFSNAVLFQPSAFYKQLPGADYLWHEIALTLAPDVNHKLAEERLMAAVESVYGTYRAQIERQHAIAVNSLHLTMPVPTPEGRLRFVEAGIEYAIRYPVVLHGTSSVDDKITRALLDAIAQEPKLRLVVSGTPTVQSAA